MVGISWGRKTISPRSEFFHSGEPRRPNRLFRFASTLFSLSLTLYSLSTSNFRCTRLQFFATPWPALRAETASRSVFSSLDRRMYLCVCVNVYECKSKYREGEKRNKKKMEKEERKKRERKEVPPSKVSHPGFSLALSALDRTKLSAVLQMKRSLCRVAAASRSLQACLAANPFFRTTFHQDRSK